MRRTALSCRCSSGLCRTAGRWSSCLVGGLLDAYREGDHHHGRCGKAERAQVPALQEHEAQGRHLHLQGDEQGPWLPYLQVLHGSGEDRSEEHLHRQGDQASQAGTVGNVHRRGHEGRQVRVPLQRSRACRRGDEGAHRLRRCGDARAAALDDHHSDRCATTTASGPPTANGCPFGTPPGTTIGSDEDGDESDAIGKDDADGCL